MKDGRTFLWGVGELTFLIIYNRIWNTTKNLTIICRQSNLHWNNSYKTYFVITDIIIYYWKFKIKQIGPIVLEIYLMEIFKNLSSPISLENSVRSCRILAFSLSTFIYEPNFMKISRKLTLWRCKVFVKWGMTSEVIKGDKRSY